MADAEVAAWTVEVTTGEGTKARTVRAASVTTEPGWVLFWDQHNNVIARFRENLVVMVSRGDVIPAFGEDRIRNVMAEAQDHPGRVITR